MMIEDWRNAPVKSMRTGFGEGLVEAGKDDENIVVLSADLSESTQVSLFQEEYPERFIEVGVAEQNLITVASGVAMAGKKPFAASYSVFSPGRNWEQIRTTICLNDRPVVIVGSHTGISVGEDGATHQMLEDIALMRSLPNMTVIAPADASEAYQVSLALAKYNRPAYMRLARNKTANFTSPKPFEIGKAQVLREGTDVALCGTGTMTYQLLVAADMLAEQGMEAEVVHVPTIKPLDNETILASARKCGRVVTAEEAQIAAGFGSAIAEFLSEELPMPVKRLGMNDEYGQSGSAAELLEHYGLVGDQIAEEVTEYIATMPQYHR